MKTKKIWIILAVICLCLGAALAGAGFALGGQLHDTLGVHFGHDFGIGVFDQARSTNATEKTELQEFKKLSMNITAGDIIIEQGNELALRVKNVPADEYEVMQEQDTLTISTKGMSHVFNLSFDALDYEFILTIPKDMTITLIDVVSKLGDVKMNGITSDGLIVDQHMGDVELVNVVCNKEIKIDQKMGDIEYEGSHPGNMDLANSMGDIDLEIYDSIDDYRYELKTSLGSIKTNREKQDGFSGTVNGGSGSAEFLIKAKNSMGDIEVEFMK